MERTGTIEELRGDRAVTRLDDGREPGTVEANNDAGAAAGDRVRVRMPEVVGEGMKGLFYAAPLAGVTAGAVAGRVLGGTGPVADFLMRIGGRFVGPLISKGDILAMLCGLLGLAASIAALSVWVNKRREAAEQEAEVVEVIAGQSDSG